MKNLNLLSLTCIASNTPAPRQLKAWSRVTPYFPNSSSHFDSHRTSWPETLVLQWGPILAGLEPKNTYIKRWELDDHDQQDQLKLCCEVKMGCFIYQHQQS